MRVTVRRAMILIAIVAVTLALVKVHTSYCWERASTHALLEEFHRAEATEAKVLWSDHQRQAQERAAQFDGLEDSELHVAFDAEAKGHRLEARFQRFTMGYNVQMARWHAAEKKRFEHAALRPWILSQEESSPPSISPPRRER